MSQTRSVRLPEALVRKLQDAARVSGKDPSELIRDALERHCDEILGHRLDRALAGRVGSVDFDVDVDEKWSARNSGRALADLLEQKAREGRL